MYNASISFPIFELECMIFYFFLTFSTFKENKGKKQSLGSKKGAHTYALVENVFGKVDITKSK